MAVPTETKVVIVGGGEVGLATSILLSLQGIDHVLFERQPTTSIFPKAIGLHNRTMEIFRKLGIEQEVYEKAAPPETCGRCAWYTSWGPEGRCIASRPALGYVLDPDSERGRAYAQASPSRYSNFAQIRLEPILRRRAEELNPRGVFFHHEVTSVMEDSEHAVVTYYCRDKGSDPSSRTITATYVVGADGGRFITSHLGIPYEGEHDILDMVTAHIRAPLSQHQPDTRNLLNWFVNPRLGGSVNSGITYHLGPYPRDPRTEEWSVLLGRLPHEREKPFTKEDMLARLHKIFCIPGMEYEILSISHWFLQAKTARDYISSGGRVFLVGDAAHRIPPWGALGGNTGFQDADNLVWKLALAIKRPDLELGGLLRSYHEERHPIGVRVARTGLGNLRGHGDALDRALGIAPDASVEDNVAAVDDYFGACDLSKSSTEAGLTKKEAVRKAAQETLDIEFFALGAEAGWFYDHSKVFDGEDWKSPQMNTDSKVESCEYRVTTMPGHQMPHAWLQNDRGDRTSTRWLVKQDRLLLLASNNVWRSLQHDMVDVVIIDDSGSVWRDVDSEWCAQREVTSAGAVLVRPDNIVAWRWMDARMLTGHMSSTAELYRIVERVLRMPEQVINAAPIVRSSRI